MTLSQYSQALIELNRKTRELDLLGEENIHINNVRALFEIIFGTFEKKIKEKDEREKHNAIVSKDCR